MPVVLIPRDSITPVQILLPSDLLILDFEQRKSQLRQLRRELDAMRSKYHLLRLEQVRRDCGRHSDDFGWAFTHPLCLM